MESLKDKVAIVGMGCTPFGEFWDKDIVDLIVDAADEAFADANVTAKDIQAAWVGYTVQDNAMTGIILSSALQLQFIPVTRVENACGTGAETIRGAALGLASKTYDLVLALGFEKMKDAGFGGIGQAWPGKWHPVYGAAPEVGGAVGRYALAATKYFSTYGLSPEEGKRMLAKISVKSHYNGSRNPKAMLRNRITIEQVLNAPIIAWPLGLFDCCGICDGASAAIMCRTEDAKRYRPKGDYITVKASAIACGPGWGKERTNYGYTVWEETEAAAKQAYAMAGIKNPRKELEHGGGARLLLHSGGDSGGVDGHLREGPCQGRHRLRCLGADRRDSGERQRRAEGLRAPGWGQRWPRGVRVLQAVPGQGG